MGHNTKALLAATVAGVLVIGGVRYWTGRTSGPDSPREGCTTVVVSASVEKSDLMAEVARRYNASDRQCERTLLWSRRQGTGSPDWPSPGSPRRTGIRHGARHRMHGPRRRPRGCSCCATTAHRTGPPGHPGGGTTHSVVSTPIVLAMPEPKARALGWPDTPIGWTYLMALANDPGGWTAKGHPEWGAFKLGKTNPNVSTTGLSATVGEFVAAAGTSSDLTLATLKEPHVRDFVAGVEKLGAHYGDTALTFLANLQRADDAGVALVYVSAVAVEEKSVVDYNNGNPTGELATVGQHAKPRSRWSRYTRKRERSTVTTRSRFCRPRGPIRTSRPEPETSLRSSVNRRSRRCSPTRASGPTTAGPVLPSAAATASPTTSGMSFRRRVHRACGGACRVDRAP